MGLDEVPFIATGYDDDDCKMVIDIISDEYNATSIEKLENFLLACQQEMSDGKLWLAMQANVLSDQSKTESDFEGRYKEMMTKLENLFTVPTLNMNMRNGENINKACQEVENQFPDYDVK